MTMLSGVAQQLTPDGMQYIAGKAGLPIAEVEKRVLSCEVMDIKGDGLDLDTHIM